MAEINHLINSKGERYRNPPVSTLCYLQNQDKTRAGGNLRLLFICVLNWEKHISVSRRTVIRGGRMEIRSEALTQTLIESSWITSKQNYYIKGCKGSEKVTARSSAEAQCFILMLNQEDFAS